MLRLGGIRVDRFRQADRTARLGVAALFPQRLAIRLDVLAEFGADGDVAVFHVDLDLVLGDARQLGLDDVRFGSLDDIERDCAPGYAVVTVGGGKERAEGTFQRVVITNKTGHWLLSIWVGGIESPHASLSWRRRNGFQVTRRNRVRKRSRSACPKPVRTTRRAVPVSARRH